MKILKYIAVGACVIFTIGQLVWQIIIRSGLDVWWTAPAEHTTKGGVITIGLLMGAIFFSAGWEIARAKFSSCQADKN